MKRDFVNKNIHTDVLQTRQWPLVKESEGWNSDSVVVEHEVVTRVGELLAMVPCSHCVPNRSLLLWYPNGCYYYGLPDAYLPPS